LTLTLSRRTGEGKLTSVSWQIGPGQRSEVGGQKGQRTPVVYGNYAKFMPRRFPPFHNGGYEGSIHGDAGMARTEWRALARKKFLWARKRAGERKRACP